MLCILLSAEMFDDIVKEYDPNGTLTDAFFFDGASNVQKWVGQFWWPSILTHSAFMGESMYYNSSLYHFQKLSQSSC